MIPVLVVETVDFKRCRANNEVVFCELSDLRIWVGVSRVIEESLVVDSCLPGGFARRTTVYNDG
jgi:hypothetical protein